MLQHISWKNNSPNQHCQRPRVCLFYIKHHCKPFRFFITPPKKLMCTNPTANTSCQDRWHDFSSSNQTLLPQVVTVFELFLKLTLQQDQFTRLATPIDVKHWWLKDETEMGTPKYFTAWQKGIKPERPRFTHVDLTWIGNNKNQRTQDTNHFTFAKIPILSRKKTTQ